jgi:hypothetical protein
MIAEGIELDNKFYAQKTAVIAKSGYGKSYAVRVIIEEGLKNGVSFIVIDPQSAYENIPQMDYVHISDIKDYKKYGMLLALTNKNVVISTKGEDIEKQTKAVDTLMRAYKKYMKKGIQMCIIDEGHKFAPEGEGTPAKGTIRGMFQENRSDGLGIIIVTQRPARLDKTILSQADNLLMGRVTSYRDKNSIMNYLDNKEDLEKISKLEIGEMFFYGFENDEAIVKKVRKSQTEHSGDTPKHLLSENSQDYYKYSNKILKRKKRSETMEDKKDIVKNIVPSVSTFKDMAIKGGKVSLGIGVAGIAGQYLGNMFSSPLPVVSSRTLGSAITMVGLYTAYNLIPNATAKDILEYSVAGSAIYTLGSGIADVLMVSNINLPAPIMNVFGMATSVALPKAEGQKVNATPNAQPVDLDTEFA